MSNNKSEKVIPSSKSDSNKIILKKIWLVILLLIIVCALIIFKFMSSTASKVSLSAWQDVHQWRVEGECADCHSKLAHIEQGVDIERTLAIPAAKTHTEQFRRFTHGKDEKLAAHSCQSCHQAQSCTTCHGILPGSHTSDFVEPAGNSEGSLRHVILAKANISSCNSCHQSFIKTCTSCHSVSEVIPWQKKGAALNMRWIELLD